MRRRLKMTHFIVPPYGRAAALRAAHLHNHPVRGMRYAPLSRSNETRHDFFNRFKLLCLL